ncbi:DUF2628 domain-containing protein [Rugamonas sp.]|uniref:DUF2628 domain-containing protein n=1 Tax=Rugamonas sp. TaxID=1926287 RepID=UPI0025D6CBB0|nr:DUF2628 domain-containing protein [Rugamonas sp.]
MSFCQQCGTEAAAATLFCAGCGANVTAPDVKAQDPNAPRPIRRADLPPTWIHNFALIEQAGGTGLPRIGKLPFGDRLRVLLNVWAFIFGPFYYAVKGMWRKGLTLLAFAIVLIAILDMLFNLSAIGASKLDLIANLVLPLSFAARANIDYYKQIVLRDNGWW